MPPKTGISKAFAAAFVVLTVSVIAGTITMVIMYEVEMTGVNATERPTFPTTTEPPPPVLRLPRSLIPDRYELVLQPRLYTRIIQEVNVTSPNQTLVFTGNSTVHFRCVQRTGSIFMLYRDLQVFEPLLTHKDTGKTIKSWVKYPDGESRFLEVALKEDLEVGGNYSLVLDFRGEISQNLEALYVSQYQEGEPEHEEDTDVDRFLAATNLEPTDARRLFPCFDEPDMKAEFSVTIIHRRDTTALSNTKMTVSNILDDEWKYTNFETTPRMSTYLLAFTVSEFTSIVSHTTDKRVTIQIFARPEATTAGHTTYANSITGKILEFFERRFDIEYELNKLDQIALPDLYPAAMENWGLVTYQEGHLLYEAGVSSLLHMEVVAVTIAHELAHQWFGNLVTMEWWNNIWLNEGFATYMSYFAVEAVEPTFKMTDVFIMGNLHAAFEEDALSSSHPLSPPQEDVQTSDEITGLFDSITYSKGSLVLRMLADVVGESVFNQGINNYLKTFRFRNTDQNDLWDSIETVSRNKYGLSVEKLMKPWTDQPGFPVVTINTTNGEVYQKQFLFNNTAESSLWWPVPIRFMSNMSESALVWLDVPGPVKKEEFISKGGEWILANVNSTGYYRVNYNLENWQRLLNQLETNPSLIPLMNRGQLIDDAFNLARAKLIDVTLALNSTLFLHKETEYLPWASAVKNLQYFVLMFDRSEVNGPMQAYLREQVKGLYNFYRNYTDNSTVPEDHSDQHNQVNAIQVACSNGLPECVEMAKTKFAEWMQPNGTNNIHPNLRSEIYCQALAAGGKDEWEFAWDQFQSSSDTSEKDQLREALSCTRKIWLLNRYLEYTLDPDKMRLMDVASTVNDIASNPAGQALAWNFIRAHWDYVKQGDPAYLIEGVTSRFSTQFELDELERFAAEYELGPGFRAAQQAIEQTRVNIQWVDDNRDVVLQWFEAQDAAGDKH